MSYLRGMVALRALVTFRLDQNCLQPVLTQGILIISFHAVRHSAALCNNMALARGGQVFMKSSLC